MIDLNDLNLQQKRLAIFFLFDKEGIIDDYVITFLKALKSISREIFVVTNNKLTLEASKELGRLVNKVFSTNKSEFDLSDYRTAFAFIGWDKIKNFDEIILCNSTIFGPIGSFFPMFSVMSKRASDYWGIYFDLNKYEFSNNSDKKIQSLSSCFIQTPFIVFRKKILLSPHLKQFLDTLSKFKIDRNVKTSFDSLLIHFFSQHGYKWDSLLNDNISSNGTNIFLENPKKAIQLGCPLLSLKSFTREYRDYLERSSAEAPIEVINYLSKDLHFNLNELYKYLVRTQHMIDLVRYLNLNFIIDSNSSTRATQKLSVALVAHLYYGDLLEESLHYLSQLPDYCDIYITVSRALDLEKVKKIFSTLPNSITYLDIENRGRDVSALLVAAREYIKKYDLVCFYHDKKVNQVKPASIGRSFAYFINESTLHSKAYVDSVISKFEKDEFLGMLSPMPPIHASYFGIGNGWTFNFENTLFLAKELDLKVPMDPSKVPVAPLGTVFWFRPVAFLDLLTKNWHYEDFPLEPNKNDGTILHAIERIYPFCVQNQGYYAGYVQPDFLASMRLNQLSYFNMEYTDAARNLGIFYCYPEETFERIRDVGSILSHFNLLPKARIPSFGLKIALKIYLNKKWSFLFQETANKFSERERNVGLRDSFFFWLMRIIGKAFR